jgi:hypothetical protein
MSRITLFLAASLLVSCGGGDDDGGDAAALDDFAERLVTTRCEAAVACHAYADVAACRAATRVTVADTRALVASGRVSFHPEHVDACLAEVGFLFSCSTSDRLVVSQAGPGGCSRVLVGTLGEGEICHASDECVDRRCEKPASCQNAPCCAGTCAPAPAIAAVGESCASASCEPAAYCQRDASGNRTTCAARIAEGQPCPAGDGCAAPAVCSLAGRCERLPGPGETCTPPYPCDAFDHVCGEAGTCVPLARVGEACVVDEAGNNCVENAYCAAGECAANPGPGAACEQSGPACQGDLECLAGVCTLAADEACAVSST